MIWAPGGLLEAAPLAIAAACALVATGWIAVRALFLRLGVTAGGAALAAALASLAFCADFASRPFQDIRVGVVVGVVVWATAFVAGKRGIGVDVDVGAVGLGLLLFLALAWVTVTTSLWDETQGHAPLAFAAASGVLPAEHPSFPGIPFPYHMSFDVLAAVFVVVGVTPIGAALDMATLCTAVACLWCLFDVGKALAGRRAGLHAMMLGLLSHGPLALWGSSIFQLPVTPLHWFTDPGTAPPPPVSSFFQHPQGFAMSVAPSVLLLAAGERLGARVAGLVLLLLLAPVNVAAFALTFAGSAVLCLRRPHLPWFTAAHVVVGLLALLVSAFGAGSGAALEVGGFFGSLPRALAGTLVFFPVFLLAGALVWQRRATMTPLAWGLAGASATGFMIGNLLHYQWSWDIVKFLSFSAYFAVVLVAGLGAGPEGFLSRVARVTLWAGVVVGALWLLRFGPLNGVAFPRYDDAPPPGFARAAAPHLHPHLEPRDCVITRASQLAKVGVRVGGLDIDRFSGFAVDRARARKDFALWQRAVDGDNDATRALGCRFLLPIGAPSRQGSRHPAPGSASVVVQFDYLGETWTLYQFN